MKSFGTPRILLIISAIISFTFTIVLFAVFIAAMVFIVSDELVQSAAPVLVRYGFAEKYGDVYIIKDSFTTLLSISASLGFSFALMQPPCGFCSLNALKVLSLPRIIAVLASGLLSFNVVAIIAGLQNLKLYKAERRANNYRY